MIAEAMWRSRRTRRHGQRRLIRTEWTTAAGRTATAQRAESQTGVESRRSGRDELLATRRRFQVDTFAVQRISALGVHRVGLESSARTEVLVDRCLVSRCGHSVQAGRQGSDVGLESGRIVIEPSRRVLDVQLEGEKQILGASAAKRENTFSGGATTSRFEREDVLIEAVATQRLQRPSGGVSVGPEEGQFDVVDGQLARPHGNALVVDVGHAEQMGSLLVQLVMFAANASHFYSREGGEFLIREI